ncbi:MAG: PH domain-containing protein [Planctomycetota bacterium]|nr:PH domain-containing protein [Planctomycetota bacterium]
METSFQTPLGRTVTSQQRHVRRGRQRCSGEQNERNPGLISMNCPKCEHELPPNAAFCPGCGQRIGEPTAAPPRAVIPPADAAGPTPHAPRDKFQPANGNSSLEDDAEVEIWHGTYSPKAMFSTWIGAALLTLVALIACIVLIPMSGLSWLGFLAAVVVVWFVLLLRLVYMRFNVSYLLTSQRFVHEEGILRRVTDRVEVIDIDDVAFEQGLVDRLVGVGIIRLSSSDRTHSELLLKGIDHVQEVASQIDAARRRERVRRGLHIEAV